MTKKPTGQVSKSAADVYEELFVPALFADWVEVVADAAAISPGNHILDVACGTGILAREALKRTGPSGSVTGLDLNEGMITTAQRVAPEIEFHIGAAESMPFDDQLFDGVVSQFGLMFFSDPVQGISEMKRVLKPGGRMAVAVWGSLDTNPGYFALTELLARLFDDSVAAELRAPFSLGDVSELQNLCERAGLKNVDVQTSTKITRYQSIEAWMNLEVNAWTISDKIDELQYRRLVSEAEKCLSMFIQDGGQVAFPSPAHVIVASR